MGRPTTGSGGAWVPVLCLVAFLGCAAAAVGAPDGGLLYYVEGPDGDPLSAAGEDRAFNPASVVKVATTLWALETVGADHRFDTAFATGGIIWNRPSK